MHEIHSSEVADTVRQDLRHRFVIDMAWLTP